MRWHALRRTATVVGTLLLLEACTSSPGTDYRIVATEEPGANRRNVRVVLDVSEYPREDLLRTVAEDVRRAGNTGQEVLRVWMYLPGMDSTSAAYATADYRRDRLHDLLVTPRIEGAVSRRMAGELGEPVRFAFDLRAHISGNTLTIEGDTDLPDGAVIVYEVTHLSDPLRMAEGSTRVSNGRYGAVESVQGWPSGEIEVWAGFQTIIGTGDEQPEDLIALVGEFGENLAGANVTLAGGLRRIEMTRRVRR